jgi:hypothetical protein
VALIAALVVAAGAPAVGIAAGFAAQDALARMVREQHQQRHPVTATVVRRLPHPPVDPDPETASDRDTHHRVVATWPVRSGTRTGPAIAPRDAAPGDRFRVWTDRAGRLVARPMDRSTADAHAALAGLGVGAAVAGTVEGARRLVVWRLVRRRYEQWDQEWWRAGQDWGRTGTGS